MDESVALDSSKQKKFVKSVRGIKKLLKKKDKNPKETTVINETSEKVIKDRKVKKRGSRGLVYLSHIPHGFYEHQMTEYFKQFGVVTNARVIRSRRTGNSKGFAFVEFKEPAVAEIVAETMNNYLMGKRLIKAAYVPPNKQRIHALRKKWNTHKNPSSDERIKFKKLHNADKNEAQEIKRARKLLLNLSNNKKKLSILGIDYDFFKPVDIPDALIDKVDNVISPTDGKSKKHVKNESKGLKEEDTKTIKTETKDVNVVVKKDKGKKKQLKQKGTENNNKSNLNNSSVRNTILKSDKRKLKDENKQKKEEINLINTTRQNRPQKKEDKLKKAGVSQNFISIKKSNDSDSSIDFDSDEFEKMMEKENDDEISSGPESSESEDEEIQEIPKMIAKGSQNKGKAKADLRVPKKQDKGHVLSQSVIKRKCTQSGPVTAKKAKFEKQVTKRPLTKVIKKR